MTHARNIEKTRLERGRRYSRRRISFISMAIIVTSRVNFFTRIWSRSLGKPNALTSRPWGHASKAVIYARNYIFTILRADFLRKPGATFNDTSCTVEKLGKTPDEKGLLRRDRRGLPFQADRLVFIQSRASSVCGISLRNWRSVS